MNADKLPIIMPIVRCLLTIDRCLLAVVYCLLAVDHCMLYVVLLIKSQFEFGFFGHHVLVPFGFEDKVDINTLKSLDGFQFLAYVLYDEIGSRTVGSSQGHVNLQPVALVVDIDLVDKTQVIDVDWNLWIIDGTEQLYYAFAKF